MQRFGRSGGVEHVHNLIDVTLLVTHERSLYWRKVHVEDMWSSPNIDCEDTWREEKKKKHEWVSQSRYPGRVLTNNIAKDATEGKHLITDTIFVVALIKI